MDSKMTPKNIKNLSKMGTKMRAFRRPKTSKNNVRSCKIKVSRGAEKDQIKYQKYLQNQRHHP